MKESLNQVVKTVPYNSFGKILINSGRIYPEEFGGNCIQQCKQLSELLELEGYDVKFLKSVTEEQILHYAILCSDGKNKFYIDPFLMHTEPINIDESLNRRQELISPAHPFQETKSSKIVFNPIGENSFEIILYGLTPEGGYKEIHTYPYDLEKVLDSLPSLDDQELNHRQKKLVMRVLEPNGAVTNLSLYHQTGFMDISRVNDVNTRARMRYETDAFLKECEKLSRHLRVRLDQVLSFFYQGHALYIDNFNPDSIYSKKS